MPSLTDWLWLILLMGLVFAFFKLKDRYTQRATDMTGSSDPKDWLNIDEDAVIDRFTGKHDIIWRECEFGSLPSNLEPHKKPNNILKTLAVPSSERYAINIGACNLDNSKVEAIQREVNMGNATALVLGDAWGAYTRSSGYSEGIWSDGRLMWVLHIEDAQRSVRDIKANRNLSPQDDMYRIWEIVARNVKLRSSDNSANTVREVFDFSRRALG